MDDERYFVAPGPMRESLEEAIAWRCPTADYRLSAIQVTLNKIVNQKDIAPKQLETKPPPALPSRRQWFPRYGDLRGGTQLRQLQEGQGRADRRRQVSHKHYSLLIRSFSSLLTIAHLSSLPLFTTHQCYSISAHLPPRRQEGAEEDRIPRLQQGAPPGQARVRTSSYQTGTSKSSSPTRPPPSSPQACLPLSPT